MPLQTRHQRNLERDAHKGKVTVDILTKLTASQISGGWHADWLPDLDTVLDAYLKSRELSRCVVSSPLIFPTEIGSRIEDTPAGESDVSMCVQHLN